MQYLVYQITNIVNGKIYVGAHATNDRNDDYMGSGRGIKAAIHKYGTHNFTKTILCECNSIEEMFSKERELVTPEFVARQDTYNRVIGGRHSGFAFDEATKRRRISEAKRGIAAWNKGKKMNYNAEALQKMSRCGSSWSPETRQKYNETILQRKKAAQ